MTSREKNRDKYLALDRERYHRNKLNPEWMAKERKRNRDRMILKRLNPEFLSKERAKGAAHKNLLWKTSPEFRSRARNNRRANYNRNPIFRNSILSRNKLWNKTERGIFCRQLREARSRDGGATLTREEWHMILEIQGMVCARCGATFSDILRPQKDHIISVAVGGGLSFENTQALCKPCNSTKGRLCTTYRQDLIDIQ